MYDKTKFRRVYIEAEQTGRKFGTKRVRLVRQFEQKYIKSYHPFADGMAELDRQIRLTVEEFAEEFRRDFDKIFTDGVDTAGSLA